MSKLNTNTLTNSATNTPHFVKIPNDLIKDSCKENLLIIPVYYYIMRHKNFENEMVGTLCEFVNCYEMTADPRYRKEEEYLLALEYLVNTYEFDIKDSRSNGEKERKIVLKDDGEYVLKDVKRNEQFIIKSGLEENKKWECGFTMVGVDEIDKILDKCYEYNQKNRNRVNTALMIGLYVYVKMYVGISGANGGEAILGMRKIEKDFSGVVSKNTIGKYVMKLEEIGMFNSEKGKMEENENVGSKYWMSITHKAEASELVKTSLID